MKRTLFAIILVLVVTFVLAEPSPLAPQSPYTNSRLALFIESDHGKDGLYLADLRTEQIRLLSEVSASGLAPVWSPDGKYLTPYRSSGVLVDIERGRIARVVPFPFFYGNGLDQWTSDSRYAVFYDSDQYGNSSATVFDTWTWTTIVSPTWSMCNYPGRQSTGGECNLGIAAISPTEPQILLRDGTLISLPDSTQQFVRTYKIDLNDQQAITSGIRSGISWGAWSPDGELLALVTHFPSLTDGQWDGSYECALHLARSDGTQVQEMVTMPCYGPLAWSQDGRSVTYWTKSHKYVLDAVQRKTQTLPVIEGEKALFPEQSDPCGNINDFANHGSSEHEEITAACWSRDSALLAIGTQDALKIYDAHFNLLHSISVDGTVHGIAWSPVP